MIDKLCVFICMLVSHTVCVVCVRERGRERVGRRVYLSVILMAVHIEPPVSQGTIATFTEQKVMVVLHQVQHCRDALKQFRYGTNILYSMPSLALRQYIPVAHIANLCLIK